MTRDTAGSRRIGAVFAAARSEGRICFIPYVVAGYPSVDESVDIALAAIDAGADLLEVGLPYSDPLADGATIQRASTASLAAGTTLSDALDIVARVVRARPSVPVLAMGYANQFMGPSAETLHDRLADGGASGAIVPDLTPDEGEPLEDVLRVRGLALVYLVAPNTPPARLAMIAGRSGGFVYCVSLSGVTGARDALPASLHELVARTQGASPLPVAVGFGVSEPAHVAAVAAAGADGVIVGSALVDALGEDGRDVGRFAALCRDLAGATANSRSAQLVSTER